MKLSPQQAWDRVYEMAWIHRWTFRRAASWFFCMYHYWPEDTMSRMPAKYVDWYRLVRDIPATQLRP
jgi:hypothetical protein